MRRHAPPRPGRRARRRGSVAVRRGLVWRGSNGWDAAVADVLRRAVEAGRLPAEPSARLLDRVADLVVLKERERALLRPDERDIEAH